MFIQLKYLAYYIYSVFLYKRNIVYIPSKKKKAIMLFLRFRGHSPYYFDQFPINIISSLCTTCERGLNTSTITASYSISCLYVSEEFSVKFLYGEDTKNVIHNLVGSGGTCISPTGVCISNVYITRTHPHSLIDVHWWALKSYLSYYLVSGVVKLKFYDMSTWLILSAKTWYFLHIHYNHLWKIFIY